MSARVIQGDIFAVLPTITPGSVDCVVTSPPYWCLRSYLPKGHALKHLELGSEPTPAAYVANMVRVFGLVRETMADHAVCFLNVGDTYSGGKRKGQQPEQTIHNGEVRSQALARTDYDLEGGALCLIPQRLTLALADDGWIVRSVIVWHKPAPMPSSVSGWSWRRCRVKVAPQRRSTTTKMGTNRESRPSPPHPNNGIKMDNAQWSDCPGCDKCTPHGGYRLRRGSWRPTSSWEPVLMLAKSAGYFADGEPVRQPSAAATVSRNEYTRVLDDPDEQFAVKHDHETTADGANLRDVWTIAAEPLHNLKFRETVYVGVDEASDGMERITSPDCPIHGRRPASNVSCDGRSVGELIRTQRTDGHPGRVPPDAGDSIPDRSSGESEPLLPSAPAAKGRSKASNKKRREPLTNLEDTASAEMLSRTGRKSSRRASVLQRLDMGENRIEADSVGGGHSPSEQTVDGTPGMFSENPQASPCDVSFREPRQRNLESNSDSALRAEDTSARTDCGSVHRSSCTCSYKKTIIKEISHFASFPTELVHRCLAAGTSAKGYCPACGAPWVRVVGEVTYSKNRPSAGNDPRSQAEDKFATANGTSGWRGNNLLKDPTPTLGWRPSCPCPPHEPRPGLVLDPFAGSCRTGLEAARLGLDFVGIDLNPDYIQMGTRILKENSPLFSGL